MRVLTTTLATFACAAVATAAPQFTTFQKPNSGPATKVVTPGAVAPVPIGGMMALTNDCSAPTPISGIGAHAYDTTAATTSGFNGTGTCPSGASTINQDLFWQWTADAAGTWTIETCAPVGFDTKLSVHSGVGCAAVCVGYNDDACSVRSRVILNAVNAGDTFVIQVGGFGSAFGTGVLTITGPPPPITNDECTTPDVIAGQGTFPYNSTTATTSAQGQVEAICLFFGNTAIDRDVWFQWTADVTGNATVATCTNTSVDTKLAAYAGAGCPADGTAIACNDDACSLQSSVTFAVTAGSTYMIQAGSFPGAAGGASALTISIAGTLTNDDCSAADVIAGQGNFAFNNSAATSGTEGQNEGICLFFGSTFIGRDVWFDWTADATGIATVTACGNTAVDTKMAAYPGSGCPLDGASLACNDDDCGLQSTISFPVTAGSTYTLQVGSFPGAAGGAGSFDITIAPPPTPITPYCFGDGSGTPCPCANDGGAGEGCANASGSGSTLSWTGSESILADDLVLSADNLPLGNNNFGLFFQGVGQVNGGLGITFGDGLRCANGTVTRLQLVAAVGGVASTTVSIATAGGATAGTTLHYQCWYRSPGGPCGSSFNFTNGLSVDWAN